MKIENFRKEKNIENDRVRVMATVTWEDCDRPVQEQFFETTVEYEDSLSCNPHAFLVASIIHAMRDGEKRVFMDEDVCPELKDGLITVMNWLRHWYYTPDTNIVAMEVNTRSSMSTFERPERAGFFFSGGVDSFATFCSNRNNFSLQHPWAIRDGLLAFGFEVHRQKDFDFIWKWLSNAAESLGINLIPVFTNIYLDFKKEDAKNEFAYWIYQYGGAALAAIAHAFVKRLSVVSISATYDLPNLNVWGSHPLLDPYYSSTDMKIKHEGLVMSRVEKTELISESDVALEYLRVCNGSDHYDRGVINCGKCEKCIRTMLSLLAAGALDRTDAFHGIQIDEETVREKANIHDDYVKSCYTELITPLKNIGRDDLVRAVNYRIEQYQARNGFKAQLKQFDQRHLGGSLKRLKRWLH